MLKQHIQVLQLQVIIETIVHHETIAIKMQHNQENILELDKVVQIIVHLVITQKIMLQQDEKLE